MFPILSRLAGDFAAHFASLQPPLPFPTARGSMRKLIVLERHTKVMRGARIDRHGRRHPAITAPFLVCTHRPTGKDWSAHTAGPRRFHPLATAS